MAKRVKTLFVSDDAVYLLVLEGKKVKKWASLFLEPGLVNQGLIVDEPQFTKELGNLFDLSKEKAGKIIIGLSGVNSLYRLISLPELPEAVLPEAVKREAQRIIPVPIDEIYLSYQHLPSQPGETQVFITTFPRNIADSLIRTLRQAGVDPNIMDLAPLALCRTLDEPRAIITNFRSGNLDIIIMEKRLPQLIRTLHLPGDVVSVSESLPSIIEEIDRTVAFYNGSHKEQPLDSTVPMFVCGDLIQIPQQFQSLCGKLGCQVSILPLSVEVPEGFNPNDFVTNIGLAFKELSSENLGTNSSLVNFNILPEIYHTKAIPRNTILTLLGAAIGIGLLVYMGLMLRSGINYTSELGSQLAAIESRVPQEQKVIGDLKKQVTKLEDTISPIEARASILETTFTSLENSRNSVNNNMSEIVVRLPKDVDFAQVNFGDKSITVSGLATKIDSSEDDIFKYAMGLRSIFPSVIISSIRVEEGEDGEFEGFSFEFLLH